MDDSAKVIFKLNGDVQSTVTTYREALDWIEDGAQFGDRIEIAIASDDEQ